MLSNAQQRAYMLWLNGADLQDYFGRTTVWKYITEIEELTGINMRANRRPEQLPIADLREILVPENIVPIPHWAHENPKRYWAPGRAFSEVFSGVDHSVKAHQPEGRRAALVRAVDCSVMADPELDRLAY